MGQLPTAGAGAGAAVLPGGWAPEPAPFCTGPSPTAECVLGLLCIVVAEV